MSSQMNRVCISYPAKCSRADACNIQPYAILFTPLEWDSNCRKIARCNYLIQLHSTLSHPMRAESLPSAHRLLYVCAFCILCASFVVPRSICLNYSFCVSDSALASVALMSHHVPCEASSALSLSLVLIVADVVVVVAAIESVDVHAAFGGRNNADNQQIAS